jgi:hypothetical protein
VIDPTVKSEIVAQLDKLNEGQQRQVLKFARSLEAPQGRGVPGKDLLIFAGAIDMGDLQTMQHFIDSDCEQVDADGW